MYSARTHAMVEKEPIQEIACALQPKTTIRIGDFGASESHRSFGYSGARYHEWNGKSEKGRQHWFKPLSTGERRTSVHNKKMSHNMRDHCFFPLEKDKRCLIFKCNFVWRSICQRIQWVDGWQCINHVSTSCGRTKSCSLELCSIHILNEFMWFYASVFIFPFFLIQIAVLKWILSISSTKYRKRKEFSAINSRVTHPDIKRIVL